MASQHAYILPHPPHIRHETPPTLYSCLSVPWGVSSVCHLHNPQTLGLFRDQTLGTRGDVVALKRAICPNTF